MWIPGAETRFNQMLSPRVTQALGREYRISAAQAGRYHGVLSRHDDLVTLTLLVRPQLSASAVIAPPTYPFVVGNWTGKD